MQVPQVPTPLFWYFHQMYDTWEPLQENDSQLYLVSILISISTKKFLRGEPGDYCVML